MAGPLKVVGPAIASLLLNWILGFVAVAIEKLVPGLEFATMSGLVRNQLIGLSSRASRRGDQPVKLVPSKSRTHPSARSPLVNVLGCWAVAVGMINRAAETNRSAVRLVFRMLLPRARTYQTQAEIITSKAGLKTRHWQARLARMDKGVHILSPWGRHGFDGGNGIVGCMPSTIDSLIRWKTL